MVVQFVAFVGAYRDPGALNPWVAAVLASLLTTWVTFVPCFVFVFLGAPYVERLRGNHALSAALTGITAAVVGVIANLAALLRRPHPVRRHHHRTLGASIEVPVLARCSLGAIAVLAAVCCSAAVVGAAHTGRLRGCRAGGGTGGLAGHVRHERLGSAGAPPRRRGRRGGG